MRKKVLCVLTVLFFCIMTFGTLFHKQIDALFREGVQIANIETYKEEYMETIDVNGIETKVIKLDTYLLLPKEAVKDSMVYVVETVEVPYGSYEVVRLQMVQTGGELDSMIKIVQGLSEKERVVAVFSDSLSDGMRVVVR